ncbi:FdhF/YdeP family oxidoreductase [Providencia rettgeri]|uniref:FdhF/YdeP family oxidoreductase n=2 Tax=Providencia rettgeri TaxID=587 RepID=A0AAP2NWG2_PRORE|nr:FdhF/YdeP family oxidoreductase [Providencia rettgeri]MBQ0210292.1 FdhF/YdeP family oxidoreductase [Providencia rettgeri]MBX6957115.1 FdhF/YdeP family oxidoreductase [Providencia rettgeri]MBX6962167.1 FdhF/YdeP family oxidoreductase [Providencia rettgeri]MBX6967769.1 FdhF/YdeP family oxidoreductase [Providencia rettgeri]MBX6972758.1 FdhF/YdeP family oxidoreductase [Providencia rettgeri]
MKKKIEEYTGPAAGWGAVKAVAEALREQMKVGHDIIAMFDMNKVDGFDCPGCAWPDPVHTASFDICENGAKAIAWEATSKRTTPHFFEKHTVTELLDWDDFHLENEGRLTHPMKYNSLTDKYEPVEWDDAFQQIGERLRSYSDPNTVEFYTSGRTSNEAAFLYQLLAREYGTNNFPDCSNMCHEPTSVGLAASIGVGKATVLLEDFDKADLIICIGHNPGTNHPRMLSSLREVSKRGAKIIAINPLRERGLERFTYPQDVIEMLTLESTPLAGHYYKVRIGGDTALIKGVMKRLIERHQAAIDSGEKALLDTKFISAHTDGYETLKNDLLTTSWDDILRVSGLSHESIDEIADLYIEAKSTIICYGMGITQHQHGTKNVQQLVNLLLLKGNIGREGAGICPLRGHSNVQGDRTVGITEKPSKSFLDKIEQRFGFRPPSEFGHAAVASMQAIYNGSANALICMGGNLAVAMPDKDACFEGMKKLDLAVHTATKLNRSHLLTAKNTFILPVLGRSEIDRQSSGVQCVTVEDSMSMVHASKGLLKPCSPYLKSECAIVAGIAKATIPNSKVEWDAFIGNYDLIRDAMEAVLPGFDNFNARIKIPGGFHLTNAASERRWLTKSGKANFIPTVGVIEDPNSAVNSELVLATLRSHDQYNTTIYGLNDRYRGVFGQRDVVFISGAEAQKQKLKAGDKVNLIALDSNQKPTKRRLDNLTVVIYDMADRCVATYFPEANNLISLDSYDPECGIPAYKNIPIKLEHVIQ